ncbi:MAG: hypothetical protein ACLU4J_24055 [Butyricimonas paravirosa]
MNPYQRPYDENGKLVKTFDQQVHYSFKEYNRNPLYDAQLNITDEEDYLNFVNNFSIEWNISELFTLMGRFSITRQTGESNYFLPAQHSKFVDMGDPVSDPKNICGKSWERQSFSLLGDINLRYGQSGNIVFMRWLGLLFQTTTD